MIEEELAQLTARLSSMGLRVNELEGAIDWHMGEDSAGSNSFGSHTMGAFSAIVVGQVTDYDNGNGFWVDFQGNTSRLFIGSSAGNKLTWDGTTLSVTGTLTATLGVIGGWTIGATTLTGSGTNAIVLTSGGTGSMRSGQTAYDTGTGWYIEAGATPRFSIGNSAGDKLLWDGSTLTVTGRLNFGTGDYIDNDLIHFEVGGAEVAAIEGKPAGWTSGPYGLVSFVATATAGGLIIDGFEGTLQRRGRLTAVGTTADNSTGASMSARTGVVNTLITVLADGTIAAVSQDSTAFEIVPTNLAFSLSGRLYLGSGSASQATRYLVDDGTRSEFFGGNLRIAAPAGLVIPTKAGTPADGDFTNAVNGLIELDTTNNLLYFRSTTWQALPGLEHPAVTNAGPVSDSNFVTDVNGNFGVDTTNHLWMFRSGAVWRIPRQPLDSKVSTTDVVNTTTETAIYSKSTPANLMGANGHLYLDLSIDYKNDSGAGDTVTVRVKFGGTSIFDDITASIPSNAARRSGRLLITLMNANNASGQFAWGSLKLDAPTAAASGAGDLGSVTPVVMAEFSGSSAVATTSAQTLEVTVQHTTANANISFRGVAGTLDIEA